jgi:hypothetical protein
MEQISIRPAGGADMAGVLELYQHLNPNDLPLDPKRGEAACTAALDAAWEAGCYKVMLASGRDEGTLRFYETRGFKRGGKTFFEARRL